MRIDKRFTAVLALVAVAATWSCGNSEGATPQDSKPASQPSGEAMEAHPALLKPELTKETAPAKFEVEFDTTAGTVKAEFIREWAPLGVDRVYNLVKIGYFADIGVFRMVPKFVCQFGLHGDPKVNAAWQNAKLRDDPVVSAISNKRGYLTFATAGPNTRSNQFFINYADNSSLDGMGFRPIGKVTVGMDIVDKFYAGYGESPQQGTIGTQGNAYLKKSFPKLEFIKSAKLIESKN